MIQQECYTFPNKHPREKSSLPLWLNTVKKIEILRYLSGRRTDVTMRELYGNTGTTYSYTTKVVKVWVALGIVREDDSIFPKKYWITKEFQKKVDALFIALGHLEKAISCETQQTENDKKRVDV